MIRKAEPAFRHDGPLGSREYQWHRAFASALRHAARTEVQARIQHPMIPASQGRKGRIIPPHFLPQLRSNMTARVCFAAVWGGGSPRTLVKFAFQGAIRSPVKITVSTTRALRHHHGEDPMKLRCAIRLASPAFALAALTFANALQLAQPTVDPVATPRRSRIFPDKFQVKYEDFVTAPIR